MEDIERDLADGLLGGDQVNDALSGDLTGAYRDAAARETYRDQDPPGLNYRGQVYRERLPRDMPPIHQPTGPVVPRATVAGVLAATLLVLVLLVVLGIH
jgi:hypothetical protein